VTRRLPHRTTAGSAHKAAHLCAWWALRTSLRGEPELQLVIHCEVHRPVGQQGHQGGAQPRVQPPHALLLHNVGQAACVDGRWASAVEGQQPATTRWQRSCSKVWGKLCARSCHEGGWRPVHAQHPHLRCPRAWWRLCAALATASSARPGGRQRWRSGRLRVVCVWGGLGCACRRFGVECAWVCVPGVESCAAHTGALGLPGCVQGPGGRAGCTGVAGAAPPASAPETAFITAASRVDSFCVRVVRASGSSAVNACWLATHARAHALDDAAPIVRAGCCTRTCVCVGGTHALTHTFGEGTAGRGCAIQPPCLQQHRTAPPQHCSAQLGGRARAHAAPRPHPPSIRAL